MSTSITLPKYAFDLRDLPAEQYILPDGLRGAVEVALALGQPLLVTGEPGTGKTRLAYKVAHDLHLQDSSFLAEPLVFSTKTTSSARDLFYYYDALRHFRESNLRKEGAAPTPAEFIELRALGKAIAFATPEEAGPYRQEEKPRQSVVLIDEIDKAPRDFPNDLLAELDQFAFEIHEDENRYLRKPKDRRVVVILTSNSEKNLPEAFLRRCVFYHIPFPDQNQLLAIVKARLGEKAGVDWREWVAFFEEIRKKANRKKPATAELIAWLKALELHQFFEQPQSLGSLSVEKKALLKLSFSVLAKTQEDLKAILETVSE